MDASARAAFVVFSVWSGGCAHTESGGAELTSRSPTTIELAESWRQQSPTRFAVARGDFDGDGKQDEARLMLSRDGKRLALIVTLSGAASPRRRACSS